MPKSSNLNAKKIYLTDKPANLVGESYIILGCCLVSNMTTCKIDHHHHNEKRKIEQVPVYMQAQDANQSAIYDISITSNHAFSLIDLLYVIRRYCPKTTKCDINAERFEILWIVRIIRHYRLLNTLLMMIHLGVLIL